ncbi:MAG: RagB/SusD family nutrient uptake outer membrane protein [Paludibacter sp.]|nr:RagB/SusD family nutrient uptake outer membrane protein [Paludibacter sp.]
MKLFKYIFSLIFVSLLFVNCSEEGLLDETELDQIDTEKVYSDVELTRRVLIDLYARMRELTNDGSGSFSRWESMTQSTTMLDNITDDGTGNGGKSKTLPVVQKMTTAGVSPTANFVAFTNPWNWYYRAIRNANQFLANVDRSPLTNTEKKNAKLEARFLRALYYHELMRWFGPLVITTDILDPFAFNTTKRENIETTIRFIVDEFDAVAQPGQLPEVWDDVNFGRATRGAALAYKARTLLYGASPLYKELGSTVTWEEAANAAEDVMDLNIYKLYYDTDPTKSYRRLFNTRVNGESILQYLRADDNDLYNCFPSEDGWNINKEGGTSPSQALIDSYDMADGTSPITGYAADNITPIINTASGYNEATPYAGREPRFYQSILYDQATWPMVNGVVNKKLDISKPFRWVSGYYLVKYLDERIDHMKGGQTSMNFQMMRYAEVLLNYAEAINETADNSSNRALAVAQLNAIRARAGITGTLDAASFTQTTLRERIQKERRVELCFEEHRFFDVRRWKIANVVLNRPAVGIQKVSGQYVRTQMENRIYNSRMDFMPIPLSDVNNCPLIYQNKGY